MWVGWFWCEDLGGRFGVGFLGGGWFEVFWVLGVFWVEVDFLGGQSTGIDWLKVPSFVDIGVVVYLKIHKSSLKGRHHHRPPIYSYHRMQKTHRNTIIKNKK